MKQLSATKTNATLQWINLTWKGGLSYGNRNLSAQATETERKTQVYYFEYQ